MQNSNIAQTSEKDDPQHEAEEPISEPSRRLSSPRLKSVYPSSAMDNHLTRGSEAERQFFATETQKYHAEISVPYMGRIPNTTVYKHGDSRRENSKDRNTHSNHFTPSALLTSYMHRRSSTATGKRRSSVKEPEDVGTEMDSLHSFAIPTYGDFLSTRVNVHFGRSPSPCTLLFDSGSGRTWVNKAVYKEMTQSEGRRLGIRVQIRYDWPGQSDDIRGWLYENSIWFGPGNPVIEKFVFAVVDEVDQPLVTQLRLQRNIVGMLGFQLSRNPFSVKRNVVAPSISHLLLKKLAPHSPSINIDFRMPEQEAYQSVDIGRIAVPGDIWIGDPEGNPLGRRNWNWHNAIKLETSSGISLVLPTIVYYSNVVSRRCVTKTDTGARWIYLPKQELNAYIKENNQRSKILHYDESYMLFYLEKENLRELKTITLVFNDKVYQMPKEGLIIPQSLLEKYFGGGKKNMLYLTLQESRKTAKPTGTPMIILGHVWITRYDIVLDFAGSRVGLAEVEGKTDYVWDELD